MKVLSTPHIVWICIIIGFIFSRSDYDTLHGQSGTTPPIRPEDTVAPIDRQITDAAFVTGVLEYLDSGRTAEASRLLRLRQGADILLINDLLATGSDQSRVTANLLFARIARATPHWKVDLGGKLDTNAVAKVESILAKFR